MHKHIQNQVLKKLGKLFYFIIMVTLFGKWLKPSLFLTNEGKEMRIYSYGIVIEKIEFPIDCFIQLDGNIVKNYVRCNE